MKKFVSFILMVGLLTGCDQSATQEKNSEQPKNETKEATLVINSNKEINGKYQATDKKTGKKIMVDVDDVNTDLIKGDELKVEVKDGKVHKVKTVKEIDTKKVEKPKQQVTEKPNVLELPEVTEKPENKHVEEPKPQIQQKPEVVQEKPEGVEQKPQIEQKPVQPDPPIEKPVEPQKPEVPQKTPQQLFTEYVASGHWTLTTNTTYFNRNKLYVYGVEEAEENFVGIYVKKYVEQNISGGKPVTVTVFHVGNGIKTYKFSW